MAEPARQEPSIDKQRTPDYGERTIKTGDIRKDQRRLRDMIKGKPRKGDK